MSHSGDKSMKPFSSWIIISLSLLSFVVTVGVSILIVLTLGEDADMRNNASAFILSCISSASLFIFWYAFRSRKVALVPAILGGLLTLLAVAYLIDLISQRHVGYFHATNPTSWIFYSLLMSSPILAIASWELQRSGKNTALKTVIGIGIVVAILLLTTVAIPVQKQAVMQVSDLDKELSDNLSHSREFERDDDESSKERERIGGALKLAAFKSVQNISRLATQSQSLPSSITPEEGYRFLGYEVMDKYKVRFCLQSVANPLSRIGAVVDWSANSGTMYWLSDVTGENGCNYENFNLSRLSE